MWVQDIRHVNTRAQPWTSISTSMQCIGCVVYHTSAMQAREYCTRIQVPSTTMHPPGFRQMSKGQVAVREKPEERVNIHIRPANNRPSNPCSPLSVGSWMTHPVPVLFLPGAATRLPRRTRPPGLADGFNGVCYSACRSFIP